MKKLAILYSNFISKGVYNIFLIDYLKKYFKIEEIQIGFSNINELYKFDIVIPVDVISQQIFNSMPISKLQSKNKFIYTLFDNKLKCYNLLKKYKQVYHIPTYTNLKIIEDYPCYKYICKDPLGCMSICQKIVTKKELTKMNIGNWIIQPYFENYKIYSLDVLAKDGIIISTLYTDIHNKCLDSVFSYLTSYVETSVMEIPNCINLFCNQVIYDFKYSGFIEFEFLFANNKYYFMEINPRLCGHISQLDKNSGSIFFNKIIVPYLKLYGYDVPKHNLIKNNKIYSGSNIWQSAKYTLKKYLG